jgi:hypothetical protein
MGTLFCFSFFFLPFVFDTKRSKAIKTKMSNYHAARDESLRVHLEKALLPADTVKTREWVHAVSRTRAIIGGAMDNKMSIATRLRSLRFIFEALLISILCVEALDAPSGPKAPEAWLSHIAIFLAMPRAPDEPEDLRDRMAIREPFLRAAIDEGLQGGRFTEEMDEPPGKEPRPVKKKEKGKGLASRARVEEVEERSDEQEAMKDLLGAFKPPSHRQKVKRCFSSDSESSGSEEEELFEDSDSGSDPENDEKQCALPSYVLVDPERWPGRDARRLRAEIPVYLEELASPVSNPAAYNKLNAEILENLAEKIEDVLGAETAKEKKGRIRSAKRFMIRLLALTTAARTTWARGDQQRRFLECQGSAKYVKYHRVFLEELEKDGKRRSQQLNRPWGGQAPRQQQPVSGGDASGVGSVQPARGRGGSSGGRGMQPLGSRRRQY